MQTCTRFLQDTFFTNESKLALIVKHDTRDLLFYIDSGLFNSMDEINKKNHDLFELINLLDYLKSIRYITIVSPSEKLSVFEALHSDFNNLRIVNGKKLLLNDNGDYLNISSPEIIYDSEDNEKLKSGKLNEYYDYIYSNMFGLIFPSEELLDFVKHDFKTKEDRKHIQNIKYSRTGIIIAILLGLLGLCNPFQKSPTVKYELKQEQLNEILKSNDNIHYDMHQLLELKKSSNDTL
jgi:hypothetical protein